ncbi:MAG TPA: sulfate adenylyltransferase [Thermodesulfobacteriota bacterium]|nr:sulfate adenylyltransferase [Thermodesulfobacteriota bacterium]
MSETGQAAARVRRAAQPGAVRIGVRVQADLEQLGVGAYAPLDGFLGEADYRSVVARMRLADGRPWALPIVLPATEAEAAALRIGEEVSLLDADGVEVGRLRLAERYRVDLEAEVRKVYGTTDPAHPGVAARLAEGPVALAGPVTLLRPRLHERFAPRALTPAETRAEFARRGWRTVVAFQTRNPIHRAHEYLQKAALEIVDGLLVHPLVGATKDDDLPADVRIRCYEALLAHYFPAGRVLLALWPAAMRYAGPREAVHHALVRRNYGCTHFIVGRDHAGVGTYYGTYDAHRIFDRFEPGELGITPLFFEHAFYCRACAGMATTKTCPHPAEAHVVLSGTKVRERLAAGQPLPPEFTRPEVAAILAAQAASVIAARR